MYFVASLKVSKQLNKFNLVSQEKEGGWDCERLWSCAVTKMGYVRHENLSPVL